MSGKDKKDIRVIVLGEPTNELLYLSDYTKTHLLTFSFYSSWSNTLKLLVELMSSTISFKPDIILNYPIYPYAFLCTLVARAFRKIHVSFVYGNDVLGKRSMLGNMLIHLTLRLTCGVICDCNSVATFVRQSGGRNVATIPMGLDVSDGSQAQVRKQPKTVICVTNFNLAYKKGVDLLIQAMKDIPECSLILVGEGSQKSLMMSEAKKSNVADRVRFSGKITRKELWICLKQATLFAMPTRSHIEGTNRAVLEAMYCGLPVVVTEIGGLPEIVKDGVNGLVVKPGNLIDLVQAIKSLLDNEHLRNVIGRNNERKARLYLARKLAFVRYNYLMYIKRKCASIG